jgi:regulator of sigma E protease
MITVLATIVVLGILIFVHELGHFLVAKILGVRVEAFSMGFPPKLIHKKIGETDYRLSVVPLGGYVKLFGENPTDEVAPEETRYSFSHHPLWHRFLIVLAGPTFNLIFAVLALSLIFTFAGIPYLTTEIGGVKPDSPAAHIGLEKGDRVLSINQQPVKRWDEVAEKIRAAGEHPVTLTIQRGTKDFQVQVTPQRMEAKDIFGSKVSALFIGISAADTVAQEQVGALKAFQEGGLATFRISWLTLESLYKLAVREAPLNSLGGPILIAQVAGKQAKLGFTHLVNFMAVLSVNLFLLNLFPVPILDGGHLFFFTLEAIRGKPMALKHREVAQGFGLMLILALMILVFYQDISRLIGQAH